MKKVFKNDGFTMVEIALAMMVMTVGVLGIFALFPIGLTASRDSKIDTQMTMLAQAIFDDLREYVAEEWDNTSGFVYEHNDDSEPVQEGRVSLIRQQAAEAGVKGAPICRLNLDIIPLDNNLQAVDESSARDNVNMYAVQLIMWPGRLQRQGKYDIRNVKFATRIARMTPDQDEEEEEDEDPTTNKSS